MPEIGANEVNQLASLTGRTVGFARSSEGDGCTRTSTDTSADAAPALLSALGFPSEALIVLLDRTR